MTFNALAHDKVEAFDEFVQPGTVGMVYGSSKVGTSNLLYMLGLHLVMEEDYLNFRISEKYRILLVDNIEGEGVLHHRQQRAVKEYGLFPSETASFNRFIYPFCRVPFDFIRSQDGALHVNNYDGLGQLLASSIRDQSVLQTIVIIDTLFPSMPGIDSDMKIDSMIDAVRDFAKEVNVAVIFAHHTRKYTDFPAGNVNLESLDWSILLKREVDENGMQVPNGSATFFKGSKHIHNMGRDLVMGQNGFWRLTNPSR